jgi:DNA mismatch repair protein MSH6
MECLVEESDRLAAEDNEEAVDGSDHNITFLYSLGAGACPKSFGINVARLAGLPEEVLADAKKISASFEAELNGADDADNNPSTYSEKIVEAIQKGDFEEAENLWRELQ